MNECIHFHLFIDALFRFPFSDTEERGVYGVYGLCTVYCILQSTVYSTYLRTWSVVQQELSHAFAAIISCILQVLRFYSRIPTSGGRNSTPVQNLTNSLIPSSYYLLPASNKRRFKDRHSCLIFKQVIHRDGGGYGCSNIIILRAID